MINRKVFEAVDNIDKILIETYIAAMGSDHYTVNIVSISGKKYQFYNSNSRRLIEDIADAITNYAGVKIDHENTGPCS